VYQVDYAFLIYETDDLEEAKSIASMRSHDKVRQKALDQGFSFDKGGFLDHRKNVTTIHNRKFTDLYNETSNSIARLTSLYQSRKMTHPAWVRQVKVIMREAYKDAYLLGMRSGGAGFGTHPFGTTTRTPALSSHDLTFIESAYRHEMRFLNTLMAQVREGSQWGDVQKRMSAYSEALKHIYYSGRVMGSPKAMAIDWISPLDRRTCPSCRYLAGNSPFTRESLPTTPRAGDTRCLNNCRCRLVMRAVNEKALRDVKRSRRSKDYYLRKLKEIKAGKKVI